ncbi:hypothetical protein K1719_002076 [Acacia pycnantha]|nr:hypothetical protein K1719_002076 [Acacia pycnantha]
MVYCSYNSISSSGSDVSRSFDPTSNKIVVDSYRASQSGLASPNSLVLNSEKEDLVNSPMKIGKKEASEAKALAAMKNHSEAERTWEEEKNFIENQEGSRSRISAI